jgi:hypothetical protein
LNCAAQKSWEGAPLESEPYNYASITLKHFLETIAQQDMGQLLDAGPITKDNINFLCLKVRKLFVFDLFRHLDQDRKKNLPSNQYWIDFDYPPNTFDGILLWNLVDRLNESEASNMVARCFSMAKTGGLLMLFTLGSKVSPSGQNVFTIREGFRLCMRSREYPHITTVPRQNRDYINLLTPFIPVKSMIYRNGIREFLFQRQ